MQPRTMAEEEIEGSGDNVHSSIRGIPNVYPDLARPPVELIRPHLRQVAAEKVQNFSCACVNILFFFYILRAKLLKGSK